jgi:hypothetical protein
MLLFNGTWQIDIANAKTWDNAAKAYIPDEVGEEIITIRVEDGVQDYEVLYGDDPVIRMGYTARFDVAEWVPYSVREIISAPGVDQEGRGRIPAAHRRQCGVECAQLPGRQAIRSRSPGLHRRADALSDQQGRRRTPAERLAPPPGRGRPVLQDQPA